MTVHDPWALPVADPLDACRVLWKGIPAMMAPVIGTDADVDGSNQAAYLRYLLFSVVIASASSSLWSQG